MSLDTVNCIADVWFRAGFLSSGDMAVSGRWVTIAELYQFADDAAKKLSDDAAAFIVIDTSITVVAATAGYTLPASQVFTVLFWISGGASLLPLRPATTGQLFALDSGWSATTGSPKRVSLDAAAVGTVTLYPNPVAGGTLNQILEEYPGTVASGNSALALSPVFQDFFSYAMLAAAKFKESDQSDAAMAAHYQGRVDLYTKLAQHLYGEGR